MRLIRWTNQRASRALVLFVTVCATIVLTCTTTAPTYAQRVFGLDTSSAANFDVSQEQWNAAFNSGYAPAGISSFKFAIVRSSHGGTNGVSPASDDAQLYQNISRATSAGMLAGSYHYPHANVYTAADEAQHYLNHAGMYMKPGYLLPVLDLEGKAGIESGVLSQADLTTWTIDFINAIFQAKGINPIVYTSSSFNTDEVTAEVAFTNIASSPHTGERTYQWLARPSGSILTGDPGAASGYPDPYGGWDPLYTTKSASTDPAVKPWAFWQNGSAHIDTSGASGYQFLIDFDAANGNIEFVRDFLVPALWTNAGNGDWGTIANWNSDNPAYTGAIENGPAPRLPGYDATNPTLGNRKYDWVKLQNTGDGTVTISSGAQSVRKFYTQQPLNITGGSLTVNYLPGSGGKWDLPSEFNAAVTLSGSAAYGAHTTQVDGGGGVFNINGGTVTFREINLASHASNSGKIVMGGDVTLTPSSLGGTATAVIQSTGSLAQAGSISLSAGNHTFTTTNASPLIDVAIRVAVTGTGAFTKAGAGTLQLAGTNTYSGGTKLSSGTLIATKDSNFGAAPGGPQAANITLDGGTLKTGSELSSINFTNFGSGYSSFPTMTISGAGADGAAPSANVLAKISSIQVTAAGSGYTGTAKVVLVGGGGTGATATAVMSGGGGVSSITITNQGTGYTSIPSVYITDGSGQGVAGSGATAVVNGITLTGIALNSAGFDYASPTVAFSGGGGSGAAATASSTTSLSLNSNRGITLTANGGTLDQTAGTTLTVGGVISSTGNGTLSKTGSGTLLLNGANTYTGATAINSGTLRIGSAERIPDGSAVTVAGGSTFDLQNNNETIGSLAGSGSVTNVSLLDAGGDDASTTFSGTISGTSLRKSGAGKLTLGGSNSYSGGTSVLGGTLSGDTITNMGTNSSFGTGNFTIANGGTLEYAGIGSSTNRTISLGSGGGTVSVVTNIGPLTVSGVIDGSALTKGGPGTLTLRGANTYTGGTTVEDGTLTVAGVNARLGTSNVTVDSVLTIQSGVNNAIDDSATLSLLGGGDPGVADQGYVNLDEEINEVVNSLLLGDIQQANGVTFGSPDSSALFKSDEYFAGAGLISVGLLGDFNNDHSVDAADFVAWRMSPSTYGGSAGYDLWQANFGNTSPASGSGGSLDGGAVPEPSAAALLIFGLAALTARSLRWRWD